ncbi:MAG: glycosyltransferase family 4 protein [Deltaproteobacteria bacterium]|nr:glycosyltransferase family 4 protein [Deltaproteobacteria bacterium]
MTATGRVRIGVPIIADQGWIGGVQYILHLVTALAKLPEPERPEIRLILLPQLAHALKLHESVLPLVDEVVVWPLDRPELARPGVRVIPTVEGLFDVVDLVLPWHRRRALPGRPLACWIPDFQHHHLPQLFPAGDLAARDTMFGFIAREAELLVLSSHAARRDFERFYPGARPAVRVLPFRAAPEGSWYEREPEAVARKHGVDGPFLICCNQFWTHKGHDTLVAALGLLRQRGVTPTLVCTGATTDYRSGDFFTKLVAAMESENLSANVRLLGLLPREEQIALVRRSLAVVQPSRFEGWSTVVEDARLLGKTILMSDIDVHLEQAPPHGSYFRVGDAVDLADQLAALLPTLAPGPDLAREARARDEAEALLVDYGRRIVALARELPAILAGERASPYEAEQADEALGALPSVGSAASTPAAVPPDVAPLDPKLTSVNVESDGLFRALERIKARAGLR